MTGNAGAEQQHAPFSVVVPARNERDRIGATLDALVGGLAGHVGVEIIVVDDSSSDGTAQFVSDHVSGRQSMVVVRTVHVAEGRGKGAAIRTGVESASNPVVVLTDADLPVSPAELLQLAQAAARTDLALGSRRLPGSSFEIAQPLARRLGGLAFRGCARALGFRGGSDPQCGAKALRVATIGPLVAACVSQNFALDAELIERCRRAGYAVVEVPVRWCHRPGSTVRPVRDFLATMQSLLRARQAIRVGTSGPLASKRTPPDAEPDVLRPDQNVRSA